MKLTLLFLVRLLIASHALEPRIIRGRKAEPGEVPYQVSLQTIASQHNFCGGVILNEYYVLSCAHCMLEKDVNLLMAVVGTVDLRLPYATHLLESSYVHEKYNRSDSWINDIALIKVKTPFVFSFLVYPVVLPRQDEIVKADSTAVVSGYGRLQGDEKTKELHIVNIKIVDQDYCKAAYQQRPSHHIIYDTQICANDPTMKKGSCKGDSGGPLTVDGKLVGLVSWSAGCGAIKYPGVYTRVPSYIDWISKYVV
ncbi:trypsin-7-like [Odontomachus brunneus]|uniref:trypsin-7-like n=1 Tax=Odontomachus brunneus TaxID=486640 RepID=UPI0013F28A3A|nr:trypsin-7-like [Odontomachus brunneus]